MEKKPLDCPTLRKYLDIIDNMYRLGWDERNGGNVSCLLDPEEANTYFDLKGTGRTIPLPLVADPLLKNRVFLFTGTTKYFRNTKPDPEHNIGVIRINDDLKSVSVLWGFEGGASFTSEIFAHLHCHATRLKVDPRHHVVLHTHPISVIEMTHVHALDEKSFTLDLWKAMTECIVVFPEGVGVLPWMVCGTEEIGLATAEKMKEARCVIWALHGIYGCEDNLDDAFGLVETVDKAAAIYLETRKIGDANTISNVGLKALAERFKVKVHPGYLE
jgi:rhamnulose-1-phosphate aldolase